MKNVAIFYGGKSAEHDISIITAIQVIGSIDAKKYNSIPVYIDQNNNWFEPKNYDDINSYLEGSVKGKPLVTGFFNGCLIQKTMLGYKKLNKIDVAINCCHGLNGEDGTLAGLLQLAQIPCVGSGVLASSVGMDKVIMKDVFVANNIPCVKYLSITKQEFDSTKDDFISKVESIIGYPAIVKPANLGSSIGIHISNSKQELEQCIQTAFSFDKKIIVEEVVSSLRELNCSVIGNYKEVQTSILEEPKNWKEFLDFNEKYILGNKNGSKKTINASAGEEIDKEIKAYSEQIFKIFGCSGVVRIDFMVNDQTKKVYVNEINTIPGSYANYLWKDKYSFKQLLNKLIDLAEEEYLYNNSHTYAYKSNVLQSYQKGQKTQSKL